VNTPRNLLIVEDDREWCGIYSRAARRQGVRSVQVANDLTDATALIDRMQFAMAFIDIGLDVGDDRNVDGLRVMDKIRSAGDETSIVVVTGRRGADVLPITRESLMRYQAHNILGKAETTPGDIEQALASGLETFEKRNSLSAAPVQAVLKGGLGPWQWDDLAMGATGTRGGVQNLYRFLGRLAAEFLPLIPETPGAAADLDESTRVMHGPYWSRAAGTAVVVCFCGSALIETHIEAAKSGRLLLGKYKVGEVLKQVSAHGASGAVFALHDVSRDNFARL
jgi:ActR/RegA family two-component response regulator